MDLIRSRSVRPLTRLLAAATTLLLAIGGSAAAPALPRGARVPAGTAAVCAEVVQTSSRCPSWASGYDYPGGHAYIGQQKARAMAVSPDGTRVYVTGSIVDDVTGVDYGTIAYDAATGALLWAARHDGPSHFHDRAYSVAVSPDGTWVFVAGVETTEVGTREVGNFATVAYDAATGDAVWVARYDGPAGGDDRAAKVVASPDGSRLYVVGPSQGTSGNVEFATVAYEAETGVALWEARYADPTAFGAIPISLGPSPDGSRVFVTGYEVLDGDGGTSAYATVAYEAKSGERRWVTRRASTPEGLERPSAMALDPSGARVFVTGTSPGAGTGDDYATVAYDAGTGELEWKARYDAGLRSDVAEAVAVSPSGDRVFVTGSSMAAPSDGVEATVSPFRIDALTVAYDASSGARAWEARFETSAVHSKETGKAIVVSPDGARVFVGGYTMPASGGEPTDPTTFGWCSSSDGYEGSIGGSDSMGSFLTTAYETSTGAQDWYATFNSSTNNPAGVDSGGIAALGISPDGARVYVAGTFAHLFADSCLLGLDEFDNYSDYWTVAYPTG